MSTSDPTISESRPAQERPVLILTRKVGEQVRIGPDITIRVVAVERPHIIIGVQAPADATVRRAEPMQARRPAVRSPVTQDERWESE